MAQGFRVEVDTPKTATAKAQTRLFTDDSGVIIDVINELKSDGKLLSNLAVRLTDRAWKLANDLPDPAFAKVPLRFYMAPVGKPVDQAKLVFEGLVTRYALSEQPDVLSIMAHDESVRARKVKRHRIVKGKTSQQFAEGIAREYGWTIDADIGDVKLAQREVHYGVLQSDWEHLRLALRADGLDCWVRGEKLYIRQSKTKDYPMTFERGKPPVIKLEASVSHIVDDGNAKTRNPFEDKATQDAALKSGQTQAKEAEKAGAAVTTARVPVGGASTKTSGGHHEDNDGSKHANLATTKRRRKDDATLSLLPTPDLSPEHIVTLNGWGPRFDGKWYGETVRHVCVPGDGGSTTSASMHRAASSKAAKETALPFQA